MPREAGEDPARPTEPGGPDNGGPAEIALHAVDSISDLHWAAGGAKGPEGNGPAASTTPQNHTAMRRGAQPALLPTLQAAPLCPCFRPPCSRTALFTLLGALVLGSLALATLAVYLSVLQSESLRLLARWLEAQEEAVRQMRATSLQLWTWLNGSEAGGQT
ncbi:leucine-rich single-pass membrane protein 2 isoform X2 [Carettochelys insculpta]|uniref:leucine-rich single-pass membrane protein 2 isoform X2 n=1 Tax=Carettochelys insculpta TaxID=44489 RepID=UPI003EBA0677